MTMLVLVLLECFVEAVVLAVTSMVVAMMEKRTFLCIQLNG